MNMTSSADWNAMIDAWLRDPDATRVPDPLGLRRRVLAENRRMTLWMLAEYAVGAALVCFVAWRLATQEGLDVFVWGFAMLWFTAMALQFSADSRKGLWSPAAETTQAYLDLALERVRRRERTTRYAWLLFALEGAFLIAWYPLTWFLWPDKAWPLIERTPWLLAVFGVATACLVGWSVAAGRRNRSERAELEQAHRELSAGG